MKSASWLEGNLRLFWGRCMSNQTNGLYEFGSFRLDVAQRLLSTAGKSVTLAPKTFDLLLLLVEGQGRVLTKRELMNLLWPDTFVEEASLSYQIAALRKAFGEEGDAWIETVPKHGYRFAATIAKPQGQIATAQKPDPTSLRQLAPWMIASVTALFAAVFAMLYFRGIQEAESRPVTRWTATLPAPDPLLGSGLSISRDGTRLAYNVQTGNSSGIWVRMLDQPGGKPIPGTEGGLRPFFSPDGQWLAYFTDRVGGLKKVPVTGGPAIALCDSARWFGGSWGEDDRIIFSGSSGLMRVSAAGGRCESLTKANPQKQEFYHWPQILPGSKSILFTIGTAGSFDNARIALLDLKSGGISRPGERRIGGTLRSPPATWCTCAAEPCSQFRSI